MVHWIIQDVRSRSITRCEQTMIMTLQELGNPVSTFTYVPFGGTDYSFLNDIKSPAVYFGTWNALHDIRKRGITVPEPFVWCDWDLFSCLSYYDKLSRYILQEDYKFAELRNISLDWYDEDISLDWKQHDDLFFRPNDNEKSFTGVVIGRNMFEGWRRNLTELFQCPADLLVIGTSVKRVYAEWRVVIVQKKAITGSMYKLEWGLNVQPEFPDDVKAFAEEVAACWSPHDVFVVDVGRTDKGLKVVEIGPFNYAGLYACDIRKTVNAINQYLK